MSVIAPTPPQKKRKAGLWSGGILATAGVITVLVGIAILYVFGSDGRVSSGRESITTPGAAIVTGAAGIGDAAGVADVIGDTSIQVSADSDRAVFIGVGPTAAVDRYLKGAAIDTVTDFDVHPFSLSKTARPGTRRVAPPARQSFWVAQDSGRHAAIDWQLRNGSYRVVAMNADGSYGVATQTTVGVKVEHIAWVAWIVIALGLLIVSTGGLLIVATVRH
ncbi:MAG: hypothetical protein QOF76_610 [Solirubrobacteraceae bacterium]|jgi:hypothetical protein|nr:hypothetical protein [Solirubrobacteraceae bacterium]